MSMTLEQAIELLAEHISRTTGKDARVREAMQVILKKHFKKSVKEESSKQMPLF